VEDSRIVELYWQKNADAIKETDSKYGAYCFAIADNILHNKEDSEECVNDTWLNAWNAMPPQKPTKLQMFLAKDHPQSFIQPFQCPLCGKAWRRRDRPRFG
jgi:hypothetical protein